MGRTTPGPNNKPYSLIAPLSESRAQWRRPWRWRSGLSEESQGTIDAPPGLAGQAGKTRGLRFPYRNLATPEDLHLLQGPPGLLPNVGRTPTFLLHLGFPRQAGDVGAGVFGQVRQQDLGELYVLLTGVVPEAFDLGCYVCGPLLKFMCSSW